MALMLSMPIVDLIFKWYENDIGIWSPAVWKKQTGNKRQVISKTKIVMNHVLTLFSEDEKRSSRKPTASDIESKKTWNDNLNRISIKYAAQLHAQLSPPGRNIKKFTISVIYDQIVKLNLASESS